VKQVAAGDDTIVSKGNIDLVVLKYMAQQVRITLHTPDQYDDDSLPLLYFLEERRARTHRIALYDPQWLLQNRDISFVGFVSMKKETIDPLIANQLQSIDEAMLTELLGIAGIAAYSSLELRPGHWYNLVLLSDLVARDHLRRSENHKYAAQELSPDYYKWIRLHSGTIHGGLAARTFQLRQTKYYTFQEGAQRVKIRARTY
jgi:hypothetical protein